MVKTHEINLSTEAFNSFLNRDFIILEDNDNDIQKSDYILFRQTVKAGEEFVPTELFRMTQVLDIITDKGLKDGYIMIRVNKL